MGTHGRDRFGQIGGRRVPTIELAFRADKEVGRYVERPREDGEVG